MTYVVKKEQDELRHAEEKVDPPDGTHDKCFALCAYMSTSGWVLGANTGGESGGECSLSLAYHI